ncbi:hypothetical protein ERJ75_001263200 [Trypanosoma vivax]|nr:hypothetical protein ERJ75_001263200 [Trypanosoma vivax]
MPDINPMAFGFLTIDGDLLLDALDLCRAVLCHLTMRRHKAHHAAAHRKKRFEHTVFRRGAPSDCSNEPEWQSVPATATLFAFSLLRMRIRTVARLGDIAKIAVRFAGRIGEAGLDMAAP